MRFSLVAFSIVVVAVVISGFASFMDGTLTSRRVTMGFLNHGGMWSDLIIMSVVTGLVFPHLARSRMLVIASMVTALLATIIMHAHWAASMRHDGTTGHMFQIHQTGTWYLALTRAGWMHAIVMTMLLTVMFMYLVSAVPVKTIAAVSFLLTAHAFLAVGQPGWYCSGKLWAWTTLGPALFLTGLVWGVAALKLQLAKGSL